MRKGIALLLLMALVSKAQTQEVDKDTLRKVARLPRINASLEMPLALSEDAVKGKRIDPKLEIAALKKRLRGDASDADRYLRLGELFDDAKDEAAALKAYAKATELFRQRLKAHPDNAHLIAQLGHCWYKSHGTADEVESLLRRAVKISPKEWQAWFDLAVVLTDRAGHEYRGLGIDLKLVESGSFTKRIEAKDCKRALRLIEEARQCLANLAAAQPQDVKAYRLSGVVRVFLSFLAAILRAAQGEEVYRQAAMFPPDALKDFRRAAEMAPNDCRTVCWATWFEIMSDLLNSKRGLPTRIDLSGKEPIWGLLSQDSQRSIRANIEKLEKLARAENRQDAASVCVILAGLDVALTADFPAAEAHCRRAVTLDPTREKTWETLMGLLLAAGKPEESLKVSLQYVQQRDTAHSRFLLAKNYEVADQFDKAEEQVRAALKLDPDDPLATLGLAALLLRRSDRPETMAEAGKVLDRAEKLAPKGDEGYRCDLAITRGIYLGLTGERDAARRLLSQVLEKDKDDKAAREVLKALEK